MSFQAVHLEDQKYRKVVVADGASNNILALKLFSGVESLICQIHRLQRAIVMALKTATIKAKRVSRVLEKCQRLAVKLRKSPKYNDELKKVCLEKDVKYLRPLAANQTCWNSVVMSLKSLVPMKPVLECMGDRDSELQWTELILDASEWKIVDAIISVLKKPLLVTKLWEADTKPTLHLVVRELYNLQTNLHKLSQDHNSYIKGLSKILLNEMEKRFPSYGAGEKLLACAHYLDPSTHGIVLEEVGMLDSTKDEIRILAKKYEQADQNSGQHSSMELDDEVVSDPETEVEELNALESLLKRRRLEKQ